MCVLARFWRVGESHVRLCLEFQVVYKASFRGHDWLQTQISMSCSAQMLLPGECEGHRAMSKCI
jgi:hypothetical protein